MRDMRIRFVGTLTALTMLAACGGSSPSSPSGGGGGTVIVRDGGASGSSGATITITAAGVSPAGVTVAVGQTVTFINNDTRPHEMASNPHPQHGTCPSIEGAWEASPRGRRR